MMSERRVVFHHSSRLSFRIPHSSFGFMRHTLSIIVADQPGELSRIVGLFSARGFNIETLSVGGTLDPEWSRVTIVTSGDDRTIEQIVKQCERLARVREVLDVTSSPHIERDLALITLTPNRAHSGREVSGWSAFSGRRLETFWNPKWTLNRYVVMRRCETL